MSEADHLAERAGHAEHFPGPPDAAGPVIFEDEAIIAIWHPGQSAELLLSFGDLSGLADGTQFFAAAPARKLALNCIGFMAKAPNWYPAASVQAAARAAQPLLTRFARRVAYGGSMGGYAALKFSRLLGASTIIALCPQWSIDPAECDGTDPGWSIHFTPAMRGMGIRGVDLNGQAFIFFDPLDARDSFHAARIASTCPRARFIWTPLVSHHVTPMLAGTPLLRELLDACQRDDVQQLRRISRRQRRSSHVYRHGMAERAVERRPRAAADWLLRAPAAPLSPPHILRLAETLARRGDARRSHACLELLAQRAPSLATAAILRHMQAHLFGRASQLRSFRDLPLVYDVATDSGRHAVASPFLPKLTLRLSGDTGRFSVNAGGAEIELGLTASGELSAGAGQATLFELLPAGPAKFHLRAGGQFLCADADGVLRCNRATAGMWETFHLA